MWKYIFSLSFGLIVSAACAQNPQGQQGEGQAQGEKKAGQPATLKEMRALRKQEVIDWSIQYAFINYDIIPTGRMVLYPDQIGQEIQGGISFYKYFALAELGFQNFKRSNGNYNYQSSGQFYRLGLDVNMFKKNTLDGGMTLGLRFGHSFFNDDVSFTRDLGFGENTYNYENKNASMIWLEATTGLHLAVSKNFRMGYMIRVKTLKKAFGLGELTPFDVAGYGRYEKNFALGFNYYLGYIIRFKELQLPPGE